MDAAASDTWLRSYRYVRIAMVGLLVGLGVAVGFQSWRQDGLLDSVSAYYYTPAQGMFVGALVGLGACMIALRGTTDLEDVLLNAGGMLAPIVAVVPTSRDDDYETALAKCREQGGPLLTGLDCPSVQALYAATRANVENNMVALLTIGGLGIVATVLFALRDRRSAGPRPGRTAWIGMAVAGGVYLVTLAAFAVSLDWFVRHAHYIAAVGLLGCIFLVALANRRRHRAERGTGPPADRYTLVAWAMVIVAVIGVPLWLAGVFALFWLEIVVALLFAVFWTVQTIEQLPS
jgi:hypothetical protein